MAAGIHAQNANRREQRMQLLLHPLGADAGIADLIRAAVGTAHGGRLGMAAIVAHEFAVRAMVGQRDTARRAGHDLTAGAAG